MSDERITPLSIVETSQISDVIFRFINSIPDLPCKVKFEELDEVAPSIAISTEATNKDNYNVVGSYDAHYVFILLYKIKGNDSRSRLDAVKLINSIGIYCAGHFNEIELVDQDTPKSFEQLSAPILVGKEANSDDVYSCQFEFVYRHKRM